MKTFFFLIGATISALVAVVSLAVATGQDLSWSTSWVVAGIETAVLLVVALIAWAVKHDALKARYVVPLLAASS